MSSASTLICVTFVTFVVAVFLTAVAFICCKKYWKDHETGYSVSLSNNNGNSNNSNNNNELCIASLGNNRNIYDEDDDETLSRFRSHFYHLACSNSNAPLVPFSPSFASTSGTMNSPSATGLDVAAAAVQLFSNQSNSLLLQSTYPLLTTSTYTTNQQQQQQQRLSNATSIGVTSLDSASIVQAAIASYLNSSASLVNCSSDSVPSYPPPPYESTHDRQEQQSHNIRELTDDVTNVNSSIGNTESTDTTNVESSDCNNSTASSFVSNNTSIVNTRSCNNNNTSSNENHLFHENNSLCNNNQRNQLFNECNENNNHDNSDHSLLFSNTTNNSNSVHNHLTQMCISGDRNSSSRFKAPWRKLSQ